MKSASKLAELLKNKYLFYTQTRGDLVFLGERFMSKTTDIQAKARLLREKRQSDINQELTDGINAALRDTKSFVRQKLITIESDMAQNIAEVKTSLNKQLQTKKTEVQTTINTVADSLTMNTQAMNEDLQKQIRAMSQNLQELKCLNQATVEQAKIKKALFSSNIVLASIALIFLISSICLGYVSKSKYSDINEMQKKVEYLKSKGGSMNISNCDNQLCIQIDTSKPNYQDGFRIVKEVN